MLPTGTIYVVYLLSDGQRVSAFPLSVAQIIRALQAQLQDQASPKGAAAELVAQAACSHLEQRLGRLEASLAASAGGGGGAAAGGRQGPDGGSVVLVSRRHLDEVVSELRRGVDQRLEAAVLRWGAGCGVLDGMRFRRGCCLIV